MKRFFNNLSLSNPKAWDASLWNLYGSQSVSGENVTEENALTYSAVWNAITLIAGTVGSLPLHLYQKQGKNKRFADDDPLYGVLHDRPNPFMTAVAFRECITAHILSWGNAYAEKVTNSIGEVRQLWPIPPKRVIRIEMREGNLWYQIRVDNDSAWLPREKILHVPGLGFDGFMGYSPIAMARKSIGLAMAEETFGARYFGAGTNPGLVVSHPQSLSAQTSANMRESLNTVYSGLSNSHRLMLLEEGMKVEKIGFPPKDSQFLEGRQFQITEIARWFNLPPHKLKDLTKSSFNNIEQEQISFVTDSILPWLIRFEQAYNMQLLTEGQKKREKLYFKHVVEGLLRADAKSRAEFYQIMVRNGIFTRNECRELEDKNPHENPLADELTIETNIGIMGQEPEPEPEVEPEPLPAPQDKKLKLLKESNRKE